MPRCCYALRAIRRHADARAQRALALPRVTRYAIIDNIRCSADMPMPLRRY